MAERRLSMFMVKLLRHDAQSKGLCVSPEGYVDVAVVLSEARKQSLNCTESDVRQIVQQDDKGRFKLRNFGSALQIKATQGHSFTVSDTELVPIIQATQVRAVLHGTRQRNWSSIRQEGLSRKNRTHIHFAESETNVKSGFPPYCDVAIEINLAAALRDGYKFYKSENDVILTPGNRIGYLPAQYIKSAYYIRTKEQLPL